MNLNNVHDCSACQFVACLGVYELECGPISFTRCSLLDVVTLFVVVISSRKATFSIFHFFELYELYFISNKVHKVRTSQLCSVLAQRFNAVLLHDRILPDFDYTD